MEVQQERQWKLEEKEKPRQTPPPPAPVKDIDFALNDKPEPEVDASLAKPAFKIGRKRNDESGSSNMLNASMPVISDLKRLDDKPPEEKNEPNTDFHRPKLFRPRGRDESVSAASGYMPSVIKEVVG